MRYGWASVAWPHLSCALTAGKQGTVCEQGAAVLCSEGSGGLIPGHQQGQLHTPHRVHT